MKKIVIVGGGLSGLASASILAHRGYEVTVYEKNKQLGGRARVLRENGYSFDMGPSWYMMPEVFEKFFTDVGKNRTDYYELIRLDPRYKVYFDDGDTYTLKDNLEQNKEVFEKVEKGAGIKLGRYINNLAPAYESAGKDLVYKNIWDLKNVLSSKNLIEIAKLTKAVPIHKSWYQYLAKYFDSEKLRKILGFPAVFLGGAPHDTPSMYSILNYSDYVEGIWYPKGGMGKIVDALEQIAREYGAKIVTESEVSKIEIKDNKVVGVIANGNMIKADLVVGACDIAYLESNILPERFKNRGKWKKKKMGISAVLVYLGINKRLKSPVHHSIYFAKDWNENFRDIFKLKKISDDPSFYFSIRSASDRTIVPKGHEEIFVLIPIGASTKYKQKEIELTANSTIAKIQELIGENIIDSIVYKKVYSSRDFMKDYMAYDGTALGLAHTFRQSLWFRPRNKSNKIKGLYYAGQYTNPGVGVPMALISAQIISNLIEDEDK